MHPRQPRPSIKHPNSLSEPHKRQQRKIINHQYRRENPRHNHRIPAHTHPIKQIQPKRKANTALAQALRDHQLARISRVAVDSVREREGEVEVAAPVDHGDAREVADPVQMEVGGHAVDD